MTGKRSLSRQENQPAMAQCGFGLKSRDVYSSGVGASFPLYSEIIANFQEIWFQNR